MRTRATIPLVTTGPPIWFGQLAGVLLIVAGAAILMGTITAEALYPVAYSTHRNTVSDLGAMRPENIVRQPSAAIFDWTLIAAGLLIVVAAYFLYRAPHRWAIVIPTALLGLGVLGAGIFPGNTGNTHALLAMLAFTAGSMAAILSWRVISSPLRYICLLLGSAALVSTVLSTSFFIDWVPVVRLGEGGIERWIAYPVVLWMVTFGAYLASGSPTKTVEDAPPRRARPETIATPPESATRHASSR
jgi:hypothetical membrane protein